MVYKRENKETKIKKKDKTEKKGQKEEKGRKKEILKEKQWKVMTEGHREGEVHNTGKEIQK